MQRLNSSWFLVFGSNEIKILGINSRNDQTLKISTYLVI